MGRPRAEVIADLNAALLGAGHSMRSASLKLGLNHSYLNQFMKEKDYSPEVLPEDVRLALAQLVGLDEKMLRIATGNEVALNEGEGIKPYSRSVPRVGTDRRETDMRIDRLYEELGRIKERLDRLEAQQPPSDRKPAQRP